jgi:hypothetical protein
MLHIDKSVDTVSIEAFPHISSPMKDFGEHPQRAIVTYVIKESITWLSSAISYQR